MGDIKNKVLLFNPTQCSGCMRCMTACSTFKNKLINPTSSHININRHEGYVYSNKGNETENLVFEASIDHDCDFCEGNPQCVKFCGQGALTYGQDTQLATGQKPVSTSSQTQVQPNPEPGRPDTGLHGYAGKVLIIDLSIPKAIIRSTRDFLCDYDIDPRQWLGGDGFIIKILWKDFLYPIDPLGPENEIIIATGPWTATSAPWAGRAMLGCISPETGAFNSGSFGWFFPSSLKYSGFDILIIRGKATKPVYVFIDNDIISFKDASYLWGKQTTETVNLIRKELNQNYDGEIHVLTTSVAGEHLVKYAPPCTDSTSAPGRTGAGAIMGSKNLKAIAVRGTGSVSVADPDGLLDASHQASVKFAENEPLIDLWCRKGATTSLLTLYGNSPNGEMLYENACETDTPHFKNVGCFNCPFPCFHWLQIKSGRYSGLRFAGGHMTYFASLVENLGISDLNAVIHFDRLTQELGIDPVSFSAAFAWAVECFNKGIIKPADIDDIPLKLGDEDLILDVLHKVAYRDGKLGNLLADGVALASKKFGPEAENLAPQVKGKAYIGSDPRLRAMLWSLGFLTNPRGGDALRCHNVWELAFLPDTRDTYPKYTGKRCLEIFEESVHKLDMPDYLKKQIFGDPPKVDLEWIKNTRGKALFTIWTENLVALFNSLVTCMYSAGTQYLMVGLGPSDYAAILNKITGWGVTYDELMKVGERIFNLERLFNYRLKNWNYLNDKWADKRQYETASKGIYKGRAVPWDYALKEYYNLRGWSVEGIPSEAKLLELKIEGNSEKLKTLA